MGGRGSKGTGTSAVFQIATNTNISPTAALAASANSAAFPATDPGPYRDMYNGRQYYQDQNFTIDQQLAMINYLSNTTEGGSLYSMSQNMNHALATGQKLTANQQFVYNNMQSAMHNLGQNANLTRYDHETMINGLLQKVGLTKSYENYTESQLKKALVGLQFGEDKFVSTSYNNFKNAPANSQRVFMSRATKVSYKADANVQAVMPGNGPGGALGEVIMGYTGGKKNMQVMDVKFTGSKARRQGSQSYSLPQVELVVRVTG